MAKQGQHNDDSQDSDKSKGPNNPSKSEIDHQLWNRLIGVNNPERTGEADDT